MKQAVVILHGMGEQIPMQTLNSFVRSVWTTDTALVNPGKPDPNTGGRRKGNVSWAKPDPRNNSTELRRITTERDEAGNYTDFYEYYWAHLMHGTTWEHVQTWIKDLLLRNPSTRVPGRVFHAWVVLWIIALVVVGLTLWGLWPKAEAPKPWLAWLSALGGMAVAAFVSDVLIKRFGDVARYVKALPPNVARRQEIRQTGVDLLDRLIKSGEYDRIVVVAHSLGSIVAYDILAMLFARYNTQLDDGDPDEMQQPERHALEEMIRAAAAGGALDLDAFQDQQAKAQDEARAQGAGWIVTDFVTLGAPLAHAEFLMAESREDMRARQESRLLPTCPPVLEYDGTTKLAHFTYAGGRDRDPQDRRLPHHAALFAYTRWTNLYSPEKAILTGDLISGPVAEVFGLKTDTGVLRGIRDIAVLPALDAAGKVAPGHRRSFFSHNNYWALDKGTETGRAAVPHHIAELRKAVRILQPRG
ncbi:hypothetical protein [Thetidibacter halocola]|uniref:Alpha/beta hydrolase n=1 Tax=Thetidibacter halocola TaxID=2827239 RepID=A0A8J7WGK1_9RHOB|nr:hypothetical protein [Thetidibacter halocola]MBS0124708.1 hypothetical protein [Thetidibacter halocola]